MVPIQHVHGKNPNEVMGYSYGIKVLRRTLTRLSSKGTMIDDDSLTIFQRRMIVLHTLLHGGGHPFPYGLSTMTASEAELFFHDVSDPNQVTQNLGLTPAREDNKFKQLCIQHRVVIPLND